MSRQKIRSGRISTPSASQLPGGENIRIAKAAGVIGGATLMSRIFGYVRDMIFAYFFGAGQISDAFIAAFRIPNLFRRLFGEGSLSMAFIPVFTEYLINRDYREAFAMAGTAIRLLAACLALIAVGGVVCAPVLVNIIAPGFGHALSELDLTIFLTRIMFPYVFFIGLLALCMGILNGLGHFAAPALAPILLNMAMISAMILSGLVSDSLKNRAVWLAAGVLLGGMLQLAMQIPFIVKSGIKFWNSCALMHDGVKRVGVMMLPAIFGAAVYQVNIMVATLLASFLPEGSISYLYYADRLVQFPLGIFGIAVANAVLPSLSRQAAAKNMEDLSTTFSDAMRLVFFITIPSMVGLMVLREPIIALLFQHGAFGVVTSRLTADALLYYCIGLWAFAGVRVVVSTFYALQDTRTPAITASIAICANVVLGIVLMQYLAHSGLALATSLSSILNLLLLVMVLMKRVARLEWHTFTSSSLKTVLASAIMGIVIYRIFFWIFPGEYGSFGRLLAGLPVCIITGIIVFSISSYLLKIPELNKIREMLYRGEK